MGEGRRVLPRRSARRRGSAAGEHLVFNKDTERDLLLFLNEDLWAGDFSGGQYAAARKARRA
jgi:hypothetical protein